MSKLTENETLHSAILKLAEQNPGAIRVLTLLVSSQPSIDPDTALGPYDPLYTLDALQIYGSKIWVLYKDVCDCSVLNLFVLFRGQQLGIIRPQSIKLAAETGVNTFDFKALLISIQKQLPNFGQNV